MSHEPDEQPFPPLTSLDRLQKIDQLRERNIGAQIPLPQLVAVGDQSSGKSSLLESVTGIPFPRGQELCTRYATQISHRREMQQRININIIPGPHASQYHQKNLESYHRQVQTAAQLRAEFPDILTEVNKIMGIKSTVNPLGEHTFSEDVLKIEKFGPEEGYLTIIDVPGIFRTTTEGVTTKVDKELVKNMVKRYIKDSRTVILAVLPSNVDVATQEILTLAEEADPVGDRTLGILTKVDLLKEETSKNVVVGLVEGSRKPLKLGYHVIMNRSGDDYGEEDNPSAALRERETMFLEYPWSKLSHDRVGVSALRERLEDLLGDITDRAFPKLRAETRHRLANAEKKLTLLGAPRQTEREQQQYLVKIASEFQTLARAALNADYSAHPAFDGNELRLATAIVNTTESFNVNFDTMAHTYLFQSEDNFETASALASPRTPAFEEVESKNEGILQPDVFDIPAPENFPDLEKIIIMDWTVESPKRGIMKWIEAVHKRSRGMDLAILSHGIFSSVFREQSAKWEAISKQYLSKIILLVHQFIIKTLEVACNDDRVLQGVISSILGNLCDIYTDAMRQIDMLIYVERQLKPYTLNHNFNYNQQKSQGARTKETLRPKARRENPGLFEENLENNLVVNLNDVSSAVTHKSNTAHARETIHDDLKAYYKVAYKRFVDNVFSQAVDYKLLSGPESPLHLFSEHWVLSLDVQELFGIAGESRRTREDRTRLRKEIQDLEVAMQILK